MTCACETIAVGGKAVVTRRDPDCRRHGLPTGYVGHPPLRRHARDGEDDRTVELRLYTEAFDPFPRPFRVCPTRFGQR